MEARLQGIAKKKTSERRASLARGRRRRMLLSQTFASTSACGVTFHNRPFREQAVAPIPCQSWNLQGPLCTDERTSRQLITKSEKWPVPVVNQIRTYWGCSPPRTGRQRMVPASLTARETGASFSKDKCVRTSL